MKYNEMELDTHQSLVMAPAQIQKLMILAMNNQELIQFLVDEQMENPMLDYEVCTEAGDECVLLGEWFRKNDYAERDDRAVVNEDMGIVEVPEKERLSLFDYLKSQIPGEYLGKKRVEIVNNLLEYIDERTGYFSEPKEYLECMVRCTKEEFEDALHLIRGMEPTGVGAFGLPDCLRLELNRMGTEDKLLTKIIECCLEDVASGNIQHISRSLKISTEKVKRYIRIIKNLNPRPAKGFGTDDTVYVIPDIKAVKDENGWEVTVKNSQTGHIRLNSMYMQMARNAEEPELKSYFEEKITRAGNVIKAIEQRETTIRKVVQCVLKYQEGFALGLSNRSHLTMRQAAEELSIHPSTVTRAVRDKYIELPSGVFAFRDLFRTAREAETEAETGGEQEQIILLIEELVNSEDKKKPLSDRKISEELDRCGVKAARRTISKYREIAGIENSSGRKAK